MNNNWNQVIYKIWSPVYDKFFNTGPFLNARKKVFQNTKFFSRQRILVVGAGTGADLQLINPAGLEITAIDYSQDMLDQARRKFKNSSIQFLEMDAQKMDFESDQFDWVVGSLILSVVPDTEACFREMKRVLKPGGKMLLFDKFLPKEKKLSLPRRIIRPAIKVLGTDIGLNFERLFEDNKETLILTEDIPVLFNGMYRKIVLSKQAL